MLDLEKTVLQTIIEAAEDWNLNDIKGLLGRCNFKAEMAERKVALLSGGEKVIIYVCIKGISLYKNYTDTDTPDLCKLAISC